MSDQKQSNDSDGNVVGNYNDISQGAPRVVDDNYQIYKTAAEINTSSEEEKAVLRKIDRRVIPILVVTYGLQYLDKNSLNFASVFGLQKGTNLHGQDYSWLGR